MTALHPDAQRLLDVVRLAGRPPVQTLSPAEAREIFNVSQNALQRPAEDVAATTELAIDGPAGPIPLRLTHGHGAPAAAAPGLLFMHGGGWMVGNLDSHDAACRRLANLASCAVLAVDYRLAPEHPFPTAVEECAAALRWMVAHAGEIGLDPARLAVGGDSAGGNLAAVLALMGRDGAVPAVACQVLIYPATDATLRNCLGSKPLANGIPFTAETMRWFVDHYIPDPAQRADWRASPLLAASLSGTPPAFVLTVGQDPLADEGRAYAARLEAEGGRVMAIHLSDHIHGIATMNRFIAAGDTVLAFAAKFMLDCWR